MFVCLGAEEWLAVGHSDWVCGTLFETRKISKVCLRIDKASAYSVGVTCDGTNDTATSSLCLTHIVQEEMYQQEVSEMVHSHRHLEAIVSPGWLRVSRLVHGSIANQMCKWSCRLESLKICYKISDALETCKFKFHCDVGAFRKSIFFRNCVYEE